ncbi:MAG: hypothetical protein PHW63_11500 [Alphaproteobacteria bacterium]|nr:hypothetical protein [Alphaproteobacteria bacterium]
MADVNHREEAKKILAGAMTADDPHAELMRGLIHAVLSLDEKTETHSMRASRGEAAPFYPADTSSTLYVFANSAAEVKSLMLDRYRGRTLVILPTTRPESLRGFRIRHTDAIIAINISVSRFASILHEDHIRGMWAGATDLPKIEYMRVDS